MSHTPGPWRVSSFNVKLVVSDTVGQSYATIIAECPSYSDSRKANANLIAAAPELLEVLERVFTVDGGYRNLIHNQKNGGSDAQWNLLQTITTVIAKAKGIQS